MAAEAAALLDELMGGSRNSMPGDNTHMQSWKDDNVCKYHLCGFCPSQLFVNTKADVGPCYKLHDEKLKKSYEESDRRGKMGYENDFLSYLERMIRDLDRKIGRGQDRLRRSAEAKQQGFSEVGGGAASERLTELTRDINTKVTELEQLGAEGLVEEAQDLMKTVEQLEKERERERLRLTGGGPKMLAGFELDTHDFHEKMELCDVCGSFLVIGDSQCRVDAHLLGKQHMGYARIRSTITELRQQQEQQVKEKEAEKQKRLEERRARSQSRERQRRRSYRRSRSRERAKGKHRSRSRGRERSRSKERDRSRSKERERSRSRGRRRSHSRGRKRSRSRGRKRSRSRGRKRSKSKERGRSRSRERKRSKSGERWRSRSKERDRSSSRGKRKRSRSKERDRSSSRGRRKRSRSKERDRSSSRGRRKRRDSKMQDRRSHSRSRSRERKKNAD